MPNTPLPKGYQRLGPFPLDDTTIFSSVVALTNYALTNGAAFIGQICAVVTDTEVDVYQIDVDRSLKIIGGGSTTAITQPPGTSDTSVATTEFVSKATTYTHVQQVSLEEWVIDHNMAKYPTFIIIDSTGEQVIGDSKYDSINRLTLTFSAAISGIAYLT
jgi:hypothetical protein